MTKDRIITTARLASARTISLTTLALVVLASSAHAQSEEEEPSKKLPLQKSTPFMDRKALSIPGRVPPLQAQPAGKQVLELDQRKANQRAKPPAPPPPPPPPAGGSADVPNISDLKPSGGKKCRPYPSNQRVSFDFKGDIQELVEAISKITCKNFIITNKVRSQKFEIVSPTPITVDEAWRAFLSALEANDFAIIRVGRYYKIIQATEGTRSPVPLFEQGADAPPVDDQMVTVIWRLRYPGDVNQVVNYLNIFKSGKGQIHPYVATGTIVATDFGTSIERLKSILNDIDKPGALEQVHVVPVQFAAATEIAEKLTQVFEPQKAGAPAAAKNTARVKLPKQPIPGSGVAGTEEDEPVAVSKILADDRTNKLIIISSERAFQQIMALMRELDVPEDGTDGQIHVLRLKHADAEELASTLSALSQGKPTSGRPSRVTGAKPAAAVPGAAASGAALFQGEVKVTADKATNSLVITASKSDLSSMRRVIERLDVPRYQVFVEAVIMEVAVKRDRTLGVGWHAGFPVTFDGQQSPIIFGNTPNQELSSIQASLSPASLVSLLGLAGAIRGPPIPSTESIIQGGIPAIGVVIQALQSSNDVNIVSTPHLLTLDNEEAEIQVNEKRPFPSGLTLGGLGGLGGLASQAGAQGLGGLGSSLGGLGLGAVSFNREDVGLTLKLKPQINDEDYVRLEIDQELSDVAGIDQVTNQVITSKRSAKTVVTVRSQDSVVIGGLVRDRETLDEAKTPLLGDIPLIGWLFKRQQRVAEKVNLILVVTPYIIRGPDDFAKIFERKMAERKEFVERFYGSAPEFRASIDWDRKLGPVATYQQSMRKEMNKAENDGPGDPNQTIIRPDGPKSLEIDPLPSGDSEFPQGETEIEPLRPPDEVMPVDPTPDLPEP